MASASQAVRFRSMRRARKKAVAVVEDAPVPADGDFLADEAGVEDVEATSCPSERSVGLGLEAPVSRDRPRVALSLSMVAVNSAYSCLNFSPVAARIDDGLKHLAAEVCGLVFPRRILTGSRSLPRLLP
jgi:hypothetical protein